MSIHNSILPLDTQIRTECSGAYSEICPGGLKIFFSFQGGGAQHPLGPENPLKSIDFTGPGGPPLITPLRVFQ